MSGTGGLSTRVRVRVRWTVAVVCGVAVGIAVAGWLGLAAGLLAG